MSIPDPQPPLPPEDQPAPPSAGGFFSFPTTPYPAPTEQDRSWAIGMHASAFIGLLVPFGNLLAPLVLWMMKKPESVYLDAVGKEVINFQLTMLIYSLVVVVLSVVTCGFGAVLGIPLLIGWVILMVLAIIKTSNGESFRYPATLRLIK